MTHYKRMQVATLVYTSHACDPKDIDATASLFKEIVPMETEVRWGLLGTERPWEEALNSLASRQRDRGVEEQKNRVLRG